MKRVFLLVLSLLTLHFALLTFVSAHILATDGSIGAILHIDPDDDPIAGEPTNLFWDFKNTKGEFKIEGCSCRIYIIEDGRKIDDEPLSSTTFTYIFPKRNVYEIRIAGQPKQGDSFQPFILSYDIRVSRETEIPDSTIQNPNKVSQRILIGAIITALGTILVLLPKKPKITN
jgi:hypothetical protein